MGGLAPVCVAVVGRGERIASADGNEIRTRVRPARLRYAQVGGDERPQASRTRLVRQRTARLSRKERLIARVSRSRNWTSEAALRTADRRKANRVVLREQRRLKRQAAAEWNTQETGL